MKPETTYETVRRLKLSELSVGDLVKVVPKSEEKKPFYAEILGFEYMASDCTWVRLCYGFYQKSKDKGIMSSNLLHIEKFEKNSKEEILQMLNFGNGVNPLS